MSLIDNLRKTTQTLLVPDVEGRLRTAETQLAALETQHGEAALDAMSGESGASERLENLNRELASARERVATLKAAHRAAVERDETTIRAQRAALQKTQLNAVRKHLELRDAATTALCDALTKAVEKYQIAVEHNAKAIAACPGGIVNFPDGSICAPGEFERRVQAELFRLSNDDDVINGHPKAFPGAECSAFPGSSGRPDTIPPLSTQAKEDSAYVMAQLTGKASA